MNFKEYLSEMAFKNVNRGSQGSDLPSKLESIIDGLNSSGKFEEKETTSNTSASQFDAPPSLGVWAIFKIPATELSFQEASAGIKNKLRVENELAKRYKSSGIYAVDISAPTATKRFSMIVKMQTKLPSKKSFPQRPSHDDGRYGH